MKEYDVIIAGGGPAGLFAAMHVNGQKTLLLERNERPGRKLLISGSGRCNFTHEGQIDGFSEHYGEKYRFIKTALAKFTNYDLIDFFSENGLPSAADENGKVFPETGSAKDVLKILLEKCRHNAVSIVCGTRALKVEKNGKNYLVYTEGGEYTCKRLLITTGGKSYPGTGSSGDGYNFAEQLGHTIILPRPALSPVIVRDFSMASLAGVSLRDRSVYLYRNGKKIRENRGDIILTHTGLSGPGILDFSRYIAGNDLLRINLADQNEDEFRKSFISSAGKEGSSSLQSFLKKTDLPRSLMRLVLNMIDLDPNDKLGAISRAARNQIMEFFCGYPFIVERVGGFDTAMVTSGGVSLKEVSSKTMESRLAKNLFFAGEVLDIDGDTGGYKLHAAFSTGFAAAESINRARNDE